MMQQGTYQLSSTLDNYTIVFDTSFEETPHTVTASVVNYEDIETLDIDVTVTAVTLTDFTVSLSELPPTENYQLIWLAQPEGYIGLIREALEVQEIANQHVWPLKVTAISSIADLPSKIFVYHAAMNDDDFMGDVFEVIASVQQLTEIPEDSPGVIDDNLQVPYYRRDTLLYHCRYPEEAEDLWEKVQEEVIMLIRNWKSMQNLEQYETLAFN